MSTQVKASEVMQANGRNDGRVKGVEDNLTPAEKADQRLAVGYAKQWEPKVMAAMDIAEKADVSTSSFIFSLIQSARTNDSAKFALVALEEKWQKSKAQKVTETRGRKAGQEVTFTPNIPSSWRFHKSALLKLVAEGPELAKKVDGDALFKAVKTVKKSEEDILKMYHLDGKLPLDCRNPRYKGDGGLKLYREDIRFTREFVKSFGKAAPADGTADGNGAKLAPLPDAIQDVITPFMRSIRDAVDHKVDNGLLAAIVKAARDQVESLVNAAIVTTRETQLEAQAEDARASALRGIEADRAEGDAEEDQAAAG
jgi:hypothetical protein